MHKALFMILSLPLLIMGLVSSSSAVLVTATFSGSVTEVDGPVPSGISIGTAVSGTVQYRTDDASCVSTDCNASSDRQYNIPHGDITITLTAGPYTWTIVGGETPAIPPPFEQISLINDDPSGYDLVRMWIQQESFAQGPDDATIWLIDDVVPLAMISDLGIPISNEDLNFSEAIADAFFPGTSDPTPQLIIQSLESNDTWSFSGNFDSFDITYQVVPVPGLSDWGLLLTAISLGLLGFGAAVRNRHPGGATA